MSAAYDMATLIATAGFGALGQTVGVNAFLDKGNNEVAVFEYAGAPDMKAHGGVVVFEYPRIQVQVRNTSSAAGWAVTYSIYKSLRGRMDVAVNGHTYQYVQSVSYPHLLVRDEQNRTIYLCELETQRSPE